MHIPWDAVQLFLAVADGGSLTSAATKLGITQPTASRRLLDLEATLGEVLFERGVGGTRLTSFGARLLEPARHMAEWAGETERIAERVQTQPTGVVRITAPPGLAFEFVAPFAAWLRDVLPEIRIEVLSTIAYLDLARREADLALRMQAPTQRDLVSVASLDFDVLPFASKGYVARLGKSPELSKLDFIAWAPPYDRLSPNSDLARMIPGFRPAFTSDDYLVQLRAAMSGLGVIFLGNVRHRFSLDTGLVPVPIKLPARRGCLHLVCAKSALDVPRVRAVADNLSKELHAAGVLLERSPKRRRAGVQVASQG